MNKTKQWRANRGRGKPEKEGQKIDLHKALIDQEMEELERGRHHDKRKRD